MPEQRVLAVAVVALLVGSAVGGAGVALLGSGGGASPAGPNATDGGGPDGQDPPDDGNDNATGTDPGPIDDAGRTGTAVDAGVEQFGSSEAFRRYVRRGQQETAVAFGAAAGAAGGNGNGDGGASVERGEPRRTVETDAISEQAGGEDRSSSTNVQEQGIDEPDILKTTGSYLYYARGPDATVREPEVRENDLDGQRAPRPTPSGTTYVFDTRDPAAPERIATINGSGRLLRTGDRLVAIRSDSLVGYDVSQPGQPTKVWSRPINGTVETARLKNGTVYLVTRSRATPETPCPIRPVGGDGAAIPCGEIYHPRGQVEVDATYSAYAVAPGDGSVRDSVGFVGTADDSVVYMSGNALYVTYTERTDLLEIMGAALADPSVGAPTYVRDRIEEVQSYNLTNRAAMVEVRTVVTRWLQGLSEQQRQQTREALQDAMNSYVRENRRNMTTTGIVRVAVDDGLSVAATGSVPGTPLNQFSMDEHEGYLRITTTIPRRTGTESANDLYVLNTTDLTRVGAEQGMGLDERVYAVRYVGDTAYVVTFRRVDPFHVVDLSNPAKPEEVGTLKLPGFSSYLHPIDDDHVLGIGREDGRVKTVLFDVSDPSNPTIDDTYFPGASWSAISSSHHAFLLDRRHGVFFLPGNDGGYVVDYTNDTLSKQTRVETDGAATRAAYIDDYLYVLSDRELVVVDERDWTVENRTEMGPVFEGPAATYQGFLEELSAGNTEAAREYVHPDSPLSDREWIASSQDELDLSVESARVTAREGSEVTLVTTTRTTTSEGSFTTRTTVTLRRQDGEWLLWSIE